MSVDLSGPVRDLLTKALARADMYLKNGAGIQAGQEYARAAELMTKYAEYALSGESRAERLKKAKEYKDLGAKLISGETIPSRRREPVSDLGGTGTVAGEDETPIEISKLIHVSKVKWDDIGGLEPTKRDIKYAYGLALAKSGDGIRLPHWNTMLFYGPPGTGKTLLAAATSNGLDAVFFNVKVSNVLSKYFGESSKIFAALYEAARKAAPAVVFIDEFESLTPQRGESGESGAERRLLSTILAELDGLAEKGLERDRYVLTVAATNAPWLMDEAILSRFQKKIFIPLPDRQARKEIFEIHLAKNGLGLADIDFNDLAERSRGFSGREIDKVCKMAIESMVGDLNADIPRIVDRGREAITDYEIRVRKLTRRDFDPVFEQVKPSTASAPQSAFEDWTSNRPKD